MNYWYTQQNFYYYWRCFREKEGVEGSSNLYRLHQKEISVKNCYKKWFNAFSAYKCVNVYTKENYHLNGALLPVMPNNWRFINIP